MNIRALWHWWVFSGNNGKSSWFITPDTRNDSLMGHLLFGVIWCSRGKGGCLWGSHESPLTPTWGYSSVGPWLVLLLLAPYCPLHQPRQSLRNKPSLVFNHPLHAPIPILSSLLPQHCVLFPLLVLWSQQSSTSIMGITRAWALIKANGRTLMTWTESLDIA